MFNRKVLVTAMLLSASSMAMADTPGFYAGLQLGQGRLNYSASDLGNTVTSSGSSDKTGMAGRVYLGYQIDPNWGLEVGYADFDQATYKNINGTGQKGKIDSHLFDLMGKGALSFNSGFGLYAKAGIGVVNASANSVAGLSDKLGTTSVRPAAGVGADYAFTPNVMVDASLTRYFSGGSIQNTDLAALGLAYYFG